MKFTDFTLDSGLQEGLAEAGYITCMPVQEQVLKNGLEGADLYVQSQTGTGKTAAYLVTILQRLVSDPALSGKKALVMVPTRELAVQVEEEARILGSCMKLKSASFYGGVGYGGQQDLLKKGVDIIIGTPGRVIDLQQSGTMNLSEVAFLVIDEADRMFDMGFYPDLRTLIKVLPKAEERQTMLFSATLNATVKNLAWEYTVEAKEITIEAENVTVDEIEQQLFHVSSEEKMKLLLGLIKRDTPESLIIFCNTKRMSEVVAKRLKINGYESDFIIGDLPQSKRLQVIDSFKSGSLKFLVATDVAARGIDVDSLAMVINYDLPNEAENYVHRIGRTARAGKTGKAYSFCSEQDVYNLPAIEKYIEAKLSSSVASEELLVEDKSSHVYIRTDRYDNDYADDDAGRGNSRGGRGRPGDSRPRSGDGRGRSGESRPRSGDTARPAGDRPAPVRSTEARPPYEGTRSRSEDGRGNDNRNRRPDGRSDTRRRDGYNQSGPRTGENRSAPADRDLSKFSFEERMAYYKTKYGSEEAAKAAENQRQDPRLNTTERNNMPQGDRARSGQGQGRDSGGRRDDNRRTPDSRGRGPQAPRNQGQGGQNRQDQAGGRSAPAGQNRPGQSGTRNQPTNQSRGGTGSRNEPRNADRNADRNVQRGSQRNASAQGKPAGAKAPAASTPKQGGLGGLIKKLFGKK